MMKTEGSLQYCYNAQLATSEDGLIVANELTEKANDYEQLEPMVEAIETNTSQRAGILLADNGYLSESNLKALERLLAGVGYGAEREQLGRFHGEVDAIAAKLRTSSMQSFAEGYAYGPTRVQFENKDPRGFAEFARILAEHSAEGSANTQLGVQKERPSLYDLEGEMQAMTVPTLIVSGDEDWPCLAPNVYMKRVIRSAALLVVPNTGHAVNLEEPEAFNRAIGTFIAQVEAGRWPNRDERAMSDSITGVSER